MQSLGRVLSVVATRIRYCFVVAQCSQAGEARLAEVGELDLRANQAADFGHTLLTLRPGQSYDAHLVVCWDKGKSSAAWHRQWSGCTDVAAARRHAPGVSPALSEPEAPAHLAARRPSRRVNPRIAGLRPPLEAARTDGAGAARARADGAKAPDRAKTNRPGNDRAGKAVAQGSEVAGERRPPS